MLAKPLLDETSPWKQRFRVPEIVSVHMARANPKRGILVGTQQSSTRQIYAWDVPTGRLRRLTDLPNGLNEGWLSPHGNSVFYLDDPTGSELGHVARVPFAGGPAQDITPELPPYTLRGLRFSDSGNRLAFNPVNREGFQLHCIDIEADGTLGPARRLYRSEWETWESVLSYGGEIAVMQSTARARGMRRYSLLAFDTTSGEQIAELWDGPEASTEPALFAPLPGNFRLLATSTRTGYKRPLLWNVRSGERIDLPLEELEGDLLPLDWSPDGQRVLLNQYFRATQQLYLYDLSHAALTRLNHPNGSFGCYGDPRSGMAFFGPGDEILALWQDSAHPSQVIALDGTTGAKKRAALPVGEVPPGHPWRSVTFPSSDGVEIQAWLGLPQGEGPFPTIMEMHGGPHFAAAEWFDAGNQAWLDHGFAYLNVNFRGSTTFGRAFMEKIWGNIGHWELEDMVAARNWLVAQGIASPEAIFLHGWSYGGFLTLWGMGKRPDLWAGGMAMIAISDWTINYEDASTALQGAFRAWFLGPPEEKPELYRASSPITYAEDVRAPVLVIQGANDTRTAARQMELYEARMRVLGKDIEVHWFDAGHGVVSVEQKVAFQERLLRFAYGVLGQA